MGFSVLPSSPNLAVSQHIKNVASPLVSSPALIEQPSDEETEDNSLDSEFEKICDNVKRLSREFEAKKLSLKRKGFFCQYKQARAKARAATDDSKPVASSPISFAPVPVVDLTTDDQSQCAGNLQTFT